MCLYTLPLLSSDQLQINLNLKILMRLVTLYSHGKGEKIMRWGKFNEIQVFYFFNPLPVLEEQQKKRYRGKSQESFFAMQYSQGSTSDLMCVY